MEEYERIETEFLERTTYQPLSQEEMENFYQDVVTSLKLERKPGDIRLIINEANDRLLKLAGYDPNLLMWEINNGKFHCPTTHMEVFAHTISYQRRQDVIKGIPSWYWRRHLLV